MTDKALLVCTSEREHTKHISDITAQISRRGSFLLQAYFLWVLLYHLPEKGRQGTDELVDGRKDRNREGEGKSIRKTCLFKYTENFIAKKMKIFR